VPLNPDTVNMTKQQKVALARGGSPRNMNPVLQGSPKATRGTAPQFNKRAGSSQRL